MTRRHFLLVAGLMLLVSSALAGAEQKIRVVATFSILADFVANVGGDRVDVTALVKSNADAHVYAPTPTDAKMLAAAKVVVANGLGYEGWLERLIKASATEAVIVVASQGIAPRMMGSTRGRRANAVDPHAWQSIANAKIYVANIRDGLIKADPAGEAVYRMNADAYLAKLDALEAEIKAAFAKIPAERRQVITTHDAFGYLAEAYGIAFIAPQGVSTESEASAHDVAQIIAQVKKQKIPAVFLENVTDRRLIQRIAEESGAKIGGTLYSDALTGPDGPAPTYIDMMRHNVRELVAALENN